LGCSAASILSVAVVDSDEMAKLNLTYRGKEGPTNVRSFAQLEGEPTARSDLLGDVVICADRARDDAAALGYPLEEMVVYLLIHGILHLVGYDHATPPDATEMHRRVEATFLKLYPDR